MFFILQVRFEFLCFVEQILFVLVRGDEHLVKLLILQLVELNLS